MNQNQGKTQKKQLKKLPLMTAGIYRAKLQSITSGKSKQNRPMYILSWEISKGCYAGRTVKSYIVTDSDVKENVMTAIIINMGFDPNAVTSLNQLIGYECRLMIEKKGVSYGMINSVEYYHSIHNDEDEEY